MITSIEQLRDRWPDRLARCRGCGTQGAHVDTTAGEITQHGFVVATVDGPVLLLVGRADGSYQGDLYCEDCREVE